MTPVDLGARAVSEPPAPKQRRVYKSVSVEGPPFQVLLDGKPVRTPLRRPLTAPSRAMIDAIAAEWDAQRETIDPASMPVTRLLATCIDKVTDGRTALTDELMIHVDADVICYRAPASDPLQARQDSNWQPIVSWLAEDLGIAMTAGEGLMPFRQSDATRSRVQAVVAALDDLRFTAVQAIAGLTGSLALALAMSHGRISAAETFEAALLEELYQKERWGDDPLAANRRAAIAADLAGVEFFLRLLPA